MKKDLQDRAFAFACRIVKLYEYLQRRRGAGRALSRQLLDAGTSIGANLVEADVGQTKADFIAKCCISLKEARETQFWLRLLAETGAVAIARIASLQRECSELVAILTTIIKKARA